MTRAAVYLACHVSGWCAGQMSIEIDDEALGLVMRRYGFATNTEAVNAALRSLAHPVREHDTIAPVNAIRA